LMYASLSPLPLDGLLVVSPKMRLKKRCNI
jgi:hypothetical protein